MVRLFGKSNPLTSPDGAAENAFFKLTQPIDNDLSTTTFVCDSAPHTRRARAFSYYSLFNGRFSVIGGMLIGAIAGHAPHLS